MNYKNPYALILGGYVNGYSIIRELHECKVKNIALFDNGSSLSSKSNKITYYDSFEKDTANSLKEALLKLHKKSDYIVIFPTDDLQLENLYEIYDDIKTFCFVPFNHKNVISSLDKYVQYNFCEKHDIPYPKTTNIETVNDLNKITDMIFPILIKPNKREDLTTNVFRSLFLEDIKSLEKNKHLLRNFLLKKTTFLASEFIPGDDTNIYAYVGYRTQDGKILNEWIGKKLTQYPDDFGVFSSGSNEAPEVVKEQGRRLLEVMDLKGINEPEFKYDSRDGKYKLMEINLRSMMWHRIGNLSGVNIQYNQYLDAIGEDVPKQIQNQKDIVHFVYGKHEILNLIFRRNYWKYFKYNLFGVKKRDFAVYNKDDVKPFLFDLVGLMRGLGGRCLRLLKQK